MDDPTVGPLQLRILRVLWTTGPAGVHAVHDALNAQATAGGTPRLAYTTVLTVLRNLAKRGIVEQKASGRSHTFIPLITEAEFNKRLVRHTVDTYFGGDAAKLAALL